MTPEARRILDRVYPWHRFEDIPRYAEDLRIELQERDDELRRRARAASDDVWNSQDWPKTVRQVRRVDKARALRGVA